MYKRGDKEFVIDMLISCQNIMEYTEGMDFSKFREDKKTKDAVIRNIEILGEAVKRLSTQIKEKYPEVEWNEIARTRDKIVHFYFGIDEEIIWDIINKDIPVLKQKLEKIIEQEGWKNEI